MKQKIIYHLISVGKALLRLAGLVLVAAVRGVWQASRYLYRNREPIMRHRLTVPLLVVLSLFWAGFRTIYYYNQPVQITGDNDNTDVNYFRLTSYHPPSQALRKSIAGWLGTPHQDGSDSKRGTDCSGFVRQVYREAYGIELKRNSREMYEEDIEVIPQKDLQEGDLVFFNTYGDGISHVGIYLDSGHFAHTSTSRGVTIDSLGSSYFRENYYGSGRVLEME